MSITDAEVLKTVITGLMIPMQVWIVLSVHRLTKGAAVQEAYGRSHDREIMDMRVRLARVETKIVELETILKSK